MDEERQHRVLSVSDLTVGYRHRRHQHAVASGIGFELEKGTLTGLVGANGIGKSTLLRTLCGMQPSLGGKLRLYGKDIANYTSMELATRLSIVLTEPPASKNLTVRELVTLGRQPYTNGFGMLTDKDREAIGHALEITESTTLSERKCYELSDGQLQRVVIARALAQDTDLVILDEPTTHLDLYHRAYVLKLLKRLTTETGKTILFSSHEIDLAIQLSDKLIVMDVEKTYVGSAKELINDGRFDALFPKETIYFDSENGRFTIKN